ncbi:MAG: YraN family protein [Candidatus Omnitrophica bacterium]|jgi:putative endonuclease|nr:YraN family protein [Candidatus Omnitrophota bacterium]MDD5081533.1 YraN family protein [Candidatus Omnitrophota bacterium]MDD5440962.1 YraN family protein [Candidatus Omnitrophota bacterium]
MFNGKFFEDKAVEFLRFKKFKIIERNWHSRWGEIDIIAFDNNYMVFCEVKGHKYNAMVTGVEAVTAAKRSKIMTTAGCYISGKIEKDYRFDVIDIAYGKNYLEILHIKNAFDVDNV